MQFGLMLFGSSQDSLIGNKYNLVIESARFADRHNFSSVWTPERHFTEFGGIYPNPSVINAALARETQRVRLQSGSLVLPLHHPIRIAEDWSIVDNLSGGRVGISFAPGWNPDDFAMFPEKYKERHNELFIGVETVRKLWQGESIQVKSGNGNLVDIRIYPKPVQIELPTWITAASSPRTFATAGQIGANILTSLLGQQSIEELTKKIALYRQNRADYGFDPDTGIVSMMLHTFVGEDFNQVRELIRGPYCEYIKSNFKLFAQGVPQSRGYNPDKVKMSEKDMDEFVNFLYEGFASSRGLIGTPETCINLIEELDAIGVNEIACLLDLGQSKELILEHLPYLDRLREIYNAQVRVFDKLPTNLANDISSKSIGAEKDETQLTNLTNGISSQAIQAEKDETQLISHVENTLPEIKNRCINQKSAQEFYAYLDKSGMQLGENYQGIESLWLGQNEALAKVKIPAKNVSHNSIKIHPALLDACHQVMGAALISTNTESVYLPIGIKNIQVHKPIKDEVFSYAALPTSLDGEEDSIEGNVRIFDLEGNLLVEVNSLQMHKANNLLDNSSLADDYSELLYEMQWQPQPISETEEKPSFLLNKEPGSWIIFADSLGVADKLVELLKQQQQSCIIVRCSETSQIQNTDEIYLNPADKESLQKLIEGVLETNQFPCRGIIHLWSLDVKSGQETTVASLQKDRLRSVTSILNLVQTVTKITASSLPFLGFVTQNVQKVGSEVVPPSPPQAPVWGLGRVIATEFPDISSKLIDLDSEVGLEDTAKQLLRELESQDRENQIVFRGGKRYIVRLVHSQKLTKETKPIDFLPDATYLITGGLGHFGINTARWIVEGGAKHLVLIGRSAPSNAAQETIDYLENLGAEVLVFQADVSNQEEMSTILNKVKRYCPQLKGIFHLAGVSQAKPIQCITPNDLDLVLGPKVLGTWILHELTLDMNLDFFFSPSSMSPIFGSKGLAHYAAANHFLDIFAHYRQSLGLSGLTVNVGILASGGMAFSSPEAQQQTIGVGLNVTEPTDILEVATRLISQNVPNIIVADMNWSIFKQLYESTTRSLLLENIEVQSQNLADRGSSPAAQSWKKLESAPENERYELLIGFLQAEVANVLGYVGKSELPNPEQGFFDMGMDSLMAVGLKNRLQDSIGCSLPTALIFEHSNVLSLAEYIIEEILHWKSSEPEKVKPNQMPNEHDIEAEISSNIKQLSDQNLENIINQELEALMEVD